ncbi:MAG TPA: M28 family peptidase [Haliangiales bacterium]|nr:M28 family peptidase [Haliangiales bacterium]
MAKLIVSVLAVAVALPAGWSAREKTAARRIHAATLAAHVRFLADDLLEGRAPASRGGELALRYIATQYERIGLRPAGDGGGWLQRFDIVGMTIEVATPITAAGGGRTLTLQPGAESILASGQQAEVAGVRDAEVVFVGYGITAPEQKWDDYKVDVRGKVLLVMNNDPENDPELFAGKRRLYYGRWDYKYAEAARHGAAGVIIIHTDHSAGYPWQVVQSSWSGRQFELPAGSEPRVQLKMWATEDACRRLAALGGKNLDELRAAAETRDFRPVPLGVKLSAELKVKLARLRTANVLGMLPGADPKRESELVVFTAHHDHLGMRDIPGDNIFNGALDNASGVAALLNVAEAFAAVEPGPRRSILFAAVAAEESGLLGSQYFCEHPIVPPGRIAANVNIDTLNIWGPTKDISFVGLGKSTLDEVVIAAAKAQGRTVVGDAQPDKGAFYRSDQFSFAKIGVPALYLGAGTLHPGHDAAWGRELHEKFTRERYHQPSDQIDDRWNLDGAVEDVQLIAVTALRIADAPRMPEWRKGDEFEAARLRALGMGGP